MAYMTRLGLWGPGTSFPLGFREFLLAISEGGVGMMELVAMHLKQDGCYLCRSLSYNGCTFETVEDAVDEQAIEIYNEAAKLWQYFHHVLVTGLESNLLEYSDSKGKGRGGANGNDSDDFDLDLDDDDLDSGEAPLGVTSGKSGKSKVMNYYWNAHQRFFRSLCVSLKVPCAINIARSAIEDGKSVIIGLQSTGESCIERELKCELSSVVTEIISPTKLMLMRTIFKLLPLPAEPPSVQRQKAKEKLKQEYSISKIKRETRQLKKECLTIDLLHDDDSDEDDGMEEDRWLLKKRMQQQRRSPSQKEPLDKKIRTSRTNTRVINIDDDEDEDEDEEEEEELVESDDTSSTSTEKGNTTKNKKKTTVQNLVSDNEDVLGDVSGTEGSEDISREEKIARMKQEGWLFEASANPYIWTRVRHFFDGQGYDGTIVSYLPAEVNEGISMWHVVHDDDDSEDLEEEEVKKYKSYFDDKLSSDPEEEQEEEEECEAQSTGHVKVIPVVSRRLTKKRVLSDEDEGEEEDEVEEKKEEEEEKEEVEE